MYGHIDELLRRYLTEAENSVTDTSPSNLRRGEGTLRDYYLLKIDLCDSTRFLLQKKHTTYLRLAHTFLSTVDHITRHFGALNTQSEYAGDGLIVYFSCDEVDAIDVLLAAHYCRYAAQQMRDLYPAWTVYEFKTKVAMHRAELIMSKIGPWGLSRVTPIGIGLHKVCKLEQKLKAGQGRTTTEFFKALDKRFSRLLSANHVDLPVLPAPAAPVPPAPTPSPAFQLAAMARALNPDLLYQTPADFSASQRLRAKGILDGLLEKPSAGGRPSLVESLGMRAIADGLGPFRSSTGTTPPVAPPTIIDNYTICWIPLRRYAEGKLIL